MLIQKPKHNACCTEQERSICSVKFVGPFGWNINYVISAFYLFSKISHNPFELINGTMFFWISDNQGRQLLALIVPGNWIKHFQNWWNKLVFFHFNDCLLQIMTNTLKARIRAGGTEGKPYRYFVMWYSSMQFLCKTEVISFIKLVTFWSVQFMALNVANVQVILCNEFEHYCCCSLNLSQRVVLKH